MQTVPTSPDESCDMNNQINDIPDRTFIADKSVAEIRGHGTMIEGSWCPFADYSAYLSCPAGGVARKLAALEAPSQRSCTIPF